MENKTNSKPKQSSRPAVLPSMERKRQERVSSIKSFKREPYYMKKG